MHENRYGILAACLYDVGCAANINPSVFGRIAPYTGLTRRVDDGLAIPCRSNHGIQYGYVAGNGKYAIGFQVIRRATLKGDNFMTKL